MRALAVAVLDAAPVGEEFDAVGGLTAPFPVQVIAELLGVGDADRDDFRRWSDAMIEAPDSDDPEVLTLRVSSGGSSTSTCATVSRIRATT